MISENFSDELEAALGISLYPYQKIVVNDVMESLKDKKFVVVSMPTGSGKTIVELAVVSLLMRSRRRVLVLEPTRILCDQMFHNFWSKLFPDAGEEYEGQCDSFRTGRNPVISTPFTASKCKPEVDVLILDEVHHAFGDPRYAEAILSLEPKAMVGFTALLPSKKRYNIDTTVLERIGSPHVLAYDFKKLSQIDSSFNLPKAIADVFDAEMDGIENVAYDALLKGKVEGNKNVLGFLRSTLSSYGKRAFCESLDKLATGQKVHDHASLSVLCSSPGFSHKARTLKEIVSSYDIEEHKPVLIFTSRRMTAHEFEVVLNSMGVNNVAILTGELKKEERLDIVNRAKRGEVDVIISTVVGEEGIDIPEAKLLVMTDVPKSPLRFYQRLGRLIRKTKGNEIKYLVVTLTPKTFEYDDLDEALRSLSNEGVDVSYILERREGKGTLARVVEQVRSKGGITTLGSLLEEEVDLDQFLLRRGKSSLFNYFKEKGNDSKNVFTDVVDMAISDGELSYYYDPEKTSHLVYLILLSKYCQLCVGEQCMDICSDELRRLGEMKSYNISRKDLLRYLTVLFTKDRQSEVERSFSYEPDPDIAVSSSANQRNRSITFTARVRASANGITVYPLVKISYYGVSPDEEKFLKRNVLAILNQAKKKFASNLSPY
ncbi:DEAD/DEAH box helicase [Metallosphaera tengchongensis]|uniref:DEAD/DEAH box helicase n=1 Tax=Metallosphaera tengchongensis TaxID=1532350 RepID=UPI001FE2981C|nr:DEAD/DEAH box helicase [Metallosphaera tengchongensis]